MVCYSGNLGNTANKVFVFSIFWHYCALWESQMCSSHFFRNSVNSASNLTYTEAAKWLKKELHNAAVFVREKSANSPFCYNGLPLMLLHQLQHNSLSPMWNYFGRVQKPFHRVMFAEALCMYSDSCSTCVIHLEYVAHKNYL